MTTRRSLHSRNTPRVYYMGSINIHIVAGGPNPPQLAIETSRMDRAPNDRIWSIISDLTPSEYERLNNLIAGAIAKFKEPGDLHPWPSKE